MKIAVVIYDRFDLVNFALINETVYNFTKSDVKICAYKSEIRDKNGLFLVPEIYGQGLYGFDCIIMPDGDGMNLANDEIYLSWLKSGFNARYKVCFGNSAIIFKAAEFTNFIHFKEFDEDKIINVLTD